MNLINITDLFYLPCHVFVKDKNGYYRDSNDYFSIKSKDFIGNNDYDFFSEKSAHFFQDSDKRILKNISAEKIFQEVEFNSGINYAAITYKRPIYSHLNKNKVIALLGLSFFTSKSKSDSLLSLSFLSKREIDCIKWLIQGKTAKEISKNLGISFRTVQFHINNIKNKFNCQKKSQVIEKIIKDYPEFIWHLS